MIPVHKHQIAVKKETPSSVTSCVPVTMMGEFTGKKVNETANVSFSEF